MKKLLYFFIIFLTFSSLHAQLDRKHWFAPMMDRTGNSNPFQKLYLSTNRTTPFPVNIYNNNILIGTVTISKGNPQKFNVNRDHIITTSQSELFTPISKGLYLEAEFPFYANLRFSVYNHAEIITSKGIASTGTTFYAAVAPITVANPILNFMTSVLATENNTTVTVSGYSTNTQFSNGTTGTTNPSITFTLNKGQSFIIEGKGDIAENSDSFIGSKITSNKPINVTNGNFNGQYAGNHPLSSDILMDQSVPINHIGNTFALVKGNGSVGNNVEGAIVVATQNNTEVFLNNETTPSATINEGDYFVVPDSKYVLQGGNSHYNLYISTTKNAYVYQLLAGMDNTGTSVATGGFNFIPALNCYLPKQIDELGYIDENQVFSNGNPNGILNIPTKLNLITETGATVTVNGIIPSADAGPHPLLGTSNWVTYGINDVTGNISIFSDKAISAGINAGSDAVGYGGFFAGFPTQPIILTSGGNCSPDISLTVDPIIYDTYQWYVNGTLIPGATNPSFTPSAPGFYTASVTMGSCAPLVTEQFKVEKCMVNSTSVYSFCETKQITPLLSSVSIPQSVVASSVAITLPPTLGIATVNSSTGVITYTANNPGTAANDSFTYTFCGNNPEFPECETVTVTVHISQLEVNNVTLNACNNNGQGTYNLSQANVSSQTAISISYYPTLEDAQNENQIALITNFTSYSATPGTVIFAVVKSSDGCKNIALITLENFPFADVADYTGNFCDDDLNGMIPVDLETVTSQILPNAGYFSVRYYANLSDATAGNNTNLPNNWTYTQNTTLYIRVDSPDGCPPVIKPVHFNFGTSVQLNTNSFQYHVCDDDVDGIKLLDLNNYISYFTSDPQVTYSFHLTLNDAQQNMVSFPNPVTVTNMQTFYIRFEKNGHCAGIASLSISVKIPKTSNTLTDQVICKNSNAVLDAGDGFDSYLWSTGATTQTINAGAGNYWVDLTLNGCTLRQMVQVSISETPVIESIHIEDSNVTITASGGNPPYEYSLDDTLWQLSNVFMNVPRGNYTAYIRDSKKCENITRNFSVINLINTITPNDDGINDSINYSELLTKEDPVFRIFDRYGAEVFRGTPSNRFTWDGMYSKGRHVSTSAYWYILQWKERHSPTVITYHSWLLVKNRIGNIFKERK